MPRILYLWQAGFPWEVRVEKIGLALQREGCEVTILARARPNEAAEGEHRGMRIVRVGVGTPRWSSLPVPFNPLWSEAIRHEVARWKPDLVLAREIIQAEPAAVICRSRGIPVIIDMAEHYPASMRTFKKYRENPLLRFLVFHARLPDLVEKRSVRLADGIITVCDEQNHRLHRAYRYPHERMAVVQNTPDIKQYDNARKGAAAPARVFGYHGAMTPQRGLDNLIAGVALVAKKDPDIRLVLAGHGESYHDLVRLADQSGAANRIHFTGRYRPEELVRLYGETDVGVVPQPPDESCDHTVPNKLYDYMACGKPVIVSPAKPLRRIVEETGTGLVLERCAPVEIARTIEQMRRLDLQAFSEQGLKAARDRLHWRRDCQVLWAFLQKYL